MRATTDPVTAGQEALDRYAWEEAREHFEAAIAVAETGAAWEGLGWTGWWLHDGALTIRAREAAFRCFRAGDDDVGAARVATWLAADHREYRGDAAVGSGWLRRAHRLLDGRPDGDEHGWLALTEGTFALAAGDAAAAETFARRAAELGRALGSPDLEAVGLAQEGVGLVVRGDVAAGMRRLDEASVIARGEDLRLPISLAWSLCYLVSACEGVGDFPRAMQWCEAMLEVGERWRGRQVLGICRTSYGRILATRGDWAGAESELTGAIDDLVASRPGTAGSGFVRLAELRARQGRLAEARQLFARAGTHAGAVVGLGELALADGDATAARDAADRVLRRTPADSVLERLPALELRARALAALGRPDDATAVATEAAAITARFGTPYLTARARALAAEVALARGDAEQARRDAEDAVDAFAQGSAPYDGAHARLVLARALLRLGRADHAATELAAAQRAFATLGAERDVARAVALGAEAEAEAEAAASPARVSELTARETEVLRLIAEGLADGEIAQRLVVSRHTVHRHVANIRAKLRQPSRAAAVAYASRAGVI